MRKNCRLIIFLLTIPLTLLVLISCGDKENNDNSNDVSSVSYLDGLQIYDGVVMGCRSDVNSVIIPEYWDGYLVFKIGSYAFSNCTNLTSVTIPNSITSIAFRAFENCTNLTSITIPDGVLSIESCAFENCINLTNIQIPSSVTSISKSSFKGCDSLIFNEYETGLYLGDYNNPYNALVDIIEKDITSFKFANNVKVIGPNVFSDCANLISVTIPSCVISIGSSAFADCTNLTNVTIPNSVISIGSSAFDNCTNLTNLTISKSITKIKKYTFYGCSSLTRIEIPNSVTEIEEFAFADSNLVSIEIPNNVKRIGGFAFASYQLECVTIANGATEISPYSFGWGGVELNEIYYNGTIDQWNNIGLSQNETFNYVNLYLLDSNGTVEHNGKKYSLYK